MIDHNVWDDWPAGEPIWLKALVSSLYRGGPGFDTALPLGCAVHEILQWVELASGEEAWAKISNRRSLIDDYHQSVDALGPSLTILLRKSVEDLSLAFADLNNSKRDNQGKRILAQSPEARDNFLWKNVRNACENLRAEFVTDAAVKASWTDLVLISRSDEFKRREHRGVANALFEQINLRDNDAEKAFRDMVDMLAYGRSPMDFPSEKHSLSVTERIDAAEKIALEMPSMEAIVVWLGYSGGRVDEVVAGNVTFMDAHWFGPNSDADWTDFVGKSELAALRRLSLFSVAEYVDERSDVDILARVDLGITSTARAVERAEALVDALLSLSVHWSGGARPLRTQSALIRNGQVGAIAKGRPPQDRFTDDPHGARLTSEAIAQFAPRLGAVLAHKSLPRYLAAAVELQTAADLPSSRDNMFRAPLDADVRGVIVSEDRVVQHVASYASLPPPDLFESLIRRWAHLRWEDEVHYATSLCLLGSGPNYARVDELRRLLYMSDSHAPWLVFVADNAKELIDLCRVESERNWVNRLFCSVSDPIEYSDLINEYEAEAKMLQRRRARVRNSLMHGNPAGVEVIKTVANISSFFSRYALRVGLESFTMEESVTAILDRELLETIPLRKGRSVEAYWRHKAQRRSSLQNTKTR